MLRKVEEILSPKESSVWARDSAILLPKVMGGLSHERRAARRSDFTEIEIPCSLPPYAPPCDRPAQMIPQPASSYQLFPGPDLSNPTQSQKNAATNSFQSQIQRAYVTQDSILPVKKLGSSYINHSVFARDMQRSHKEMLKKDNCRLNPERKVSARNGPKLYPYKSTKVPLCEASAPWVAEHPSAASGDHSLTALQIAKSLSEMDFLPVEKTYPLNHRSIQPRHYGCDYALASEANYCWEKEVNYELKPMKSIVL